MENGGDSHWIESVLGIVGTFMVVVAVVLYAQNHIPETQVVSLNLISRSDVGIPASQPSRRVTSDEEGAIRDENLSLGGELYQMFCATCHAMPDQQATVGFWLGSDLFDGKSEHEDSPEGLRRLIEEGIIEEGMTPMQGVLSEQQMDSIVAWMLDERQKIGL